MVLRTGGELLATVPASRDVSFLFEDVVDALESDLVVEDPDGPIEVFAMTDAAPEEFEGRLVMGRRVVLVPQCADGTPRKRTRCPHCQQLGSRSPNLWRGKLPRPLSSCGVGEWSPEWTTLHRVRPVTDI